MTNPGIIVNKNIVATQRYRIAIFGGPFISPGRYPIYPPNHGSYSNAALSGSAKLTIYYSYGDTGNLH